MCGIVGYVGKNQAQDFLLNGLQSLEYRGYDSSGVAVISPDGAVKIVKRAGKVNALIDACAVDEPIGTTGIAHTRWATHGAPTEINAHPHIDESGEIAVVHNGIIENNRELREELTSEGHIFVSETDTEVVAHLIERAYTGDLLAAFREAISQVKGTFAIVAMHKNHPGELVAAREGSPLIAASMDDGAYLSSDITALVNITRDVITIDNGQFAQLLSDGTVNIVDADGNAMEPQTMHVDWEIGSAGLEGYPDFMLKEISEQPSVVERMLQDRLIDGRVVLDGLNMDESELAKIDRVFMVACGTSYHASLIAKAVIEAWAKVPVEVDVASEFNYRDVLVSDNTLCIIVTQSGETADTLTSARKLQKLGAHVIACTNVLGSTAAREADGVIYTKAGPEVSVAATKSFMGQIVAMMLLGLFLAGRKGTLTPEEVTQRFEELEKTPDMLRELLTRSEQAERAASICENRSSVLFLGRGINAPTAKEGALKLKEISYVHAEAYPSGEIKHGPIALLEKNYPVVVVMPQDKLRNKTLSNVQEVSARGAVVACVATDGDPDIAHAADHVMWIQEAPAFITPILSIVPLQFFARKTALNRGHNVDQPRNLAKTVTVE